MPCLQFYRMRIYFFIFFFPPGMKEWLFLGEIMLLKAVLELNVICLGVCMYGVRVSLYHNAIMMHDLPDSYLPLFLPPPDYYYQPLPHHCYRCLLCSVNFMKNERAYDGKTSDVLRMVQEMDKNPPPEPEGEVTSLLSPDKDVVQGHSFKLLQQSLETYGDAGRSCQDTERIPRGFSNHRQKQIYSSKIYFKIGINLSSCTCTWTHSHKLKSSVVRSTNIFWTI